MPLVEKGCFKLDDSVYLQSFSSLSLRLATCPGKLTLSPLPSVCFAHAGLVQEPLPSKKEELPSFEDPRDVLRESFEKPRCVG